MSLARAERSLRFLECPRRRLEGVFETDEPVCEKDGDVYCGWEVGSGAGCCGPVAFLFFGEEAWSSRLISTTNSTERTKNSCLNALEADLHYSYLLVMWVVANGGSILKVKIAVLAAELFAIEPMGGQVVPAVFAFQEVPVVEVVE
jgi:hypothetical protein